jgi:hypothetical protein
VEISDLPSANKPRLQEAGPRKYKRGEADLDLTEAHEIYEKDAIEYALNFGWSIATCMNDALEKRHEGKKYLTVRECDIAWRSNYDLGNDMIFEAMEMFGTMLTEGIVGEDGNPWELREYYNRGVAFMVKSRLSVSEERRLKAEEAMKTTVDSLTECGLPPTSIELLEGFHPALTRPEYMTEYQYKRARSERKITWGFGDD